MRSQGWLKCKVHKGMFSDERVVELQHAGRSSHFIVPIDAVKEQGVESVAVERIRNNGGWWVVIPSPERPTLPVRESDFVA